MGTTGLDPRLTFNTFVAGPANRLAGAAALRVAEAPGTSYNPLVFYGVSGVGKTHLLMAIGEHAANRNPQLDALYVRAQQLLDASDATQRLRDRLRAAHLLLLDDVQLLAEHDDAQEALLQAWDAILARSGQLVLASDRPPNEIQRLDRRLHSRITGGLVADIAPPEHDTRVQIAERMALQRGQTLAEGVADTLAANAFGSVRELQGALNRILAVQELEERAVLASEVPSLLGLGSRGGEFGSLISDVSGALGEALERLSPEQRIAEAILRWEGEGYATTRLDAALARTLSAEDAKDVVTRFESDVRELRSAEMEIRAMDGAAPELARVDVLRDPDQLAAARALAARARERLAAGQRSRRAGTDGPNGGPPSDESRTPGRTASRARPRPASARADQGVGVIDPWFLSREKVLWTWPAIEDRVIAETD